MPGLRVAAPSVVRPAGLAIGSLFSGYGGLDLAVRHVFGGRAVWHSDTDRAACRVLAHRFPGVPNLGDITRIDWGSVQPIDILAGGFPCQDVSSAGKRAGLAPGTRSGLWAHMAHAVDRLQPRLVVFENVRGLLNAPTTIRPMDRDHLGNRAPPGMRALGTVLGDLAELGYNCRWLGLPASAIGAAHQRFRVFGLAWPRGTNPASLQPQRRRTRRDLPGTRPGPVGVTVDGHPHRDRPHFGRYEPAIRHWEHVRGRPAPYPVIHRHEGRDHIATRFTEWLMGLEPGWVTDVPDITRTMANKMLGNGVVPAHGATALRLLLQPIPIELDPTG